MAAAAARATTWPTPSTTAPWPGRRPTVVGGRSYQLLEALAGRLAERPADRRPPARGGRGDRAQAPPAAAARRRLDRGAGARTVAGRVTAVVTGSAPPSAAAAGLHRPGLQPGGPPGPTCAAAVAGLRRRGDVVAVSPLYETEPVGGPAGQGPSSTWWSSWSRPIDPARAPRALPRRSRRRPAGCGRSAGARAPSMPTSSAWRASAVDEDDLTVPHPRLWERRFVLRPAGRPGPRPGDSDAASEAAGGEVVRVGNL